MSTTLLPPGGTMSATQDGAAQAAGSQVAGGVGEALPQPVMAASAPLMPAVPSLPSSMIAGANGAEIPPGIAL